MMLGYLLLAACGGGDDGGGGSTPPPAPPAAPKIAYPAASYGFSVNVTAQPIEATSTGGAVASWSVAPSLPAGLTFDTSDGSISGTPTAATALATYLVTATNSGGKSTFTLTLAVGPAPVLDVGHANALALIRFNGSALLSLDSLPTSGLSAESLGHWLLQDYATGAILASGDLADCTNPFNCLDVPAQDETGFTYPAVDMAGDTMIDPIPGGTYATCCNGLVISAPSGVEIRQASTGQVLAKIGGQFWWYQLATDGSYLVTASDTSLTAYSLSGQTLFSLPGVYRTAIVSSTPTAVQVAFRSCPADPPVCPGKSGTNVIEIIPVATGSPSATTPFQGSFYQWFPDGARFLTILGSTVYAYSGGGAQLDSTQVQPFGDAGTAQGSWWWTLDDSGLHVYKVGASATPALTVANAYPTVVSSGSTLGLFSGPSLPSHQLTVIDLSGSTPLSATYTTPVGAIAAYGASAAATWITGDDNGVLFDGTSLGSQPRFLTLGAVQSIAAGSSYYSIATASGQIRYFNASTNTSAGTISFPSVNLVTSSDGSVLAATNGSLNLFQGEGLIPGVDIYSLPGGTLINSFTYSTPPNSLAMSLSASGTVLSQITCSPATSGGPGNISCTAQANAVTGGATLWSDTTGKVDKVQLSPDGTLVTASTQRFSSPNPVTSIYQNGMFVTSAPGWIVGWLDDMTFLVDNYQVSATPPNDTVYLGNIIYGATGTVVSKPSLPQAIDYTVIASDAVYSASNNTIYPVTTSAPIWMSTSLASGIGAASASQVVFTSGTLVLAQPR